MHLYPRANPPASLRPIVRFALEVARLVCDHVTTVENEKLRSKGVAMHAYSVSAYYACTGNQLIRLGRSRSKRTQTSNFVVDNESRFFFDA